METPSWEADNAVTRSPNHPVGSEGVGESATVGAPAVIANAVVDASRISVSRASTSQ